MTTNMFRLSESQSGPFLNHGLSPGVKREYITGSPSGARTAYPSRSHESCFPVV